MCKLLHINGCVCEYVCVCMCAYTYVGIWDIEM